MATTKIRGTTQLEIDGNIDFNAKKITNLATCTADTDAATKAYVDGLLGANDAMQFKGTVGSGGTLEIAAFNSLSTYQSGWSYRVITAGTIKGKVCEIGDLVIAIVDRAGSGNVDADWTVVQTNLDGAVIGPASATDGNVALFDGTTGKLLKNGFAPSSKVDGNTAITGATKTKITYDAKGLVTSGADATTADIADSTDKRYCTDAQKTVISNTSGTNSGDETLQTLGTKIHGSAYVYQTPADADEIPVCDSTASWIVRKLSMTNLKAFLKSYFDTLYQTVASALTASNFVDNEVPTGTKNDTNKTFTLANTPVSGTEHIYLCGLRLTPGAGNDYTISGNTITMVQAPRSTDNFICDYRK